MDFTNYAFAQTTIEGEAIETNIHIPKAAPSNVYSLNFNRQQFLYLASERLSRTFEITKGYVKLTQYADNGRETIFSILKPGDMFGVMGPGPFITHDYAQALTDLEVNVFESAFSGHFDKQKYGFAVRMMDAQMKRVRHLQNFIASVAFMDVRLRILSFLKFLAKEYGKIQDHTAFMDNFLTHQDMALLNQTSRQSVTMVLSRLKMDGVVFYDRYQLIIHLDKLEQSMRGGKKG